MRQPKKRDHPRHVREHALLYGDLRHLEGDITAMAHPLLRADLDQLLLERRRRMSALGPGRLACENSKGIKSGPNFIGASDGAETRISRKVSYCAARRKRTARFLTDSVGMSPSRGGIRANSRTVVAG